MGWTDYVNVAYENFKDFMSKPMLPTRPCLQPHGHLPNLIHLLIPFLSFPFHTLETFFDTSLTDPPTFRYFRVLEYTEIFCRQSACLLFDFLKAIRL